MAATTKAKKGMGASPLGKSEGRRRSLVSTLGDSSGIGQMVPLDQIAANPANPPARVEDVQDLAASVGEVGVLQPVLLVPAAVFVEANPHDAEAVDGRAWVLLAGHRRVAAARLAGLDEVHAILREDLSRSGRDAEIMLHENLHRRELTPLEEARAYARIAAERGLSQRQIAQHTGVSQGQIAKRLSLLKGTEAVQAAVESGDLPTVHALEWVKEPEDLQDAAIASLLDPDAPPWRRDNPERVLSDSRDQLAREVQLAAAAARAEHEGIEVYDGVDYTRTLTEPKEIEEARQRGDLYIAPAGRWTSDTDPKFVTKDQGKQRPASKREEQERKEKRERNRAAKARFEALTVVAKTKPPKNELMKALVQMTLAGGGLGDQATALGRKLSRASGIGPQDTEDWTWRGHLPQAQRSEHLAWIVYLAWQEYRARLRHVGWDLDQVAYLELLTDRAGYEPSEWEQVRMHSARDRAEQTEDEGQ